MKDLKDEHFRVICELQASKEVELSQLRIEVKQYKKSKKSDERNEIREFKIQNDEVQIRIERLE